MAVVANHTKLKGVKVFIMREAQARAQSIAYSCLWACCPS